MSIQVITFNCSRAPRIILSPMCVSADGSPCSRYHSLICHDSRHIYHVVSHARAASLLFLIWRRYRRISDRRTTRSILSVRCARSNVFRSFVRSNCVSAEKLISHANRRQKVEIALLSDRMSSSPRSSCEPIARRLTN